MRMKEKIIPNSHTAGGPMATECDLEVNGCSDCGKVLNLYYKRCGLIQIILKRLRE